MVGIGEGGGRVRVRIRVKKEGGRERLQGKESRKGKIQIVNVAVERKVGNR